jgi:hypothetical protein
MEMGSLGRKCAPRGLLGELVTRVRRARELYTLEVIVGNNLSPELDSAPLNAALQAHSFLSFDLRVNVLGFYSRAEFLDSAPSQLAFLVKVLQVLRAKRIYRSVLACDLV